METVNSIWIFPYNTKMLLLLIILAPRMTFCSDCPSSIFEHAVNSEGAFEFPLFYRHHPCVEQQLGPHPSSSESITDETMELPIDLIRDGNKNNFLFLMPIKLGTPPVWNLVAVDTGATFSFVQCQPCTLGCHEQDPAAGQIFDPSKSETFRRVGCSREYCRSIQSELRPQSKACMEIEDSCLYTMTFGSGSTYSVGKVVVDRLTVGQQNDTAASVPSFYFGCSLDTKYNYKEAGLVGFGGVTFSFFEQVAPLVSYKAFSYCFPSDRRKKGYLSIGDYDRAAASSSASYTPLFLPKGRSSYSLKLDKVVANGITLETYPSEMIVDSGSKWTVLLSSTFDQLDSVITNVVEPLGYTRFRDRRLPGPNYICFEEARGFFTTFSNWSALPVLELSFDMGVTLKLPPQSSFYNDGRYGLCSYFLREAAVATGTQIMGNSVTRSIGITFDIQSSKFAFRNGDC